MGLGVMRKVYDMSIHRQEEWRDDDRGLLLVNVTHSPISDAKRQTSLYKLAGDSTFADGALDNTFTEESIAEHRPIPLRECSAYNPEPGASGPGPGAQSSEV